MSTAFGVPKLPSVRLKRERFCSNVRRIFPNTDDEAVQRLWGIVEAAMEQRHGTLIAVSAAAETEANRLERQALCIGPTQLTPDLVRHLSSIDGALLLDPEGTCHAIGVILDGMATGEGDPARGARYNSAVRYINSAESTPTMCLVVSEDGDINMIPDLRPQVRRSDVESQVALLKTQGIDTYHKTRNWLDAHRFYVSGKQCEVVNKELDRIRSASNDAGAMWLIISPFKPHSDMNDSYYLPEADPEGTGEHL